jgi:hypothetical protein
MLLGAPTIILKRYILFNHVYDIWMKKTGVIESAF